MKEERRRAGREATRWRHWAQEKEKERAKREKARKRGERRKKRKIGDTHVWEGG